MNMCHGFSLLTKSESEVRSRPRIFTIAAHPIAKRSWKLGRDAFSGAMYPPFFNVVELSFGFLGGAFSIRAGCFTITSFTLYTTATALFLS